MNRFCLVSLATCLVLVTARIASAELIDCVIEPRSTVNLGSTDEGKITEIMVSRGDRVSTGQELVRLDDEIERLLLEVSEIRAKTDVEVRGQEARLALRSKELERVEQLRRNNIAADTVYDDAVVERELTALALEEARTTRLLADVEMRQAATRLKRRTLTSPIDGIVTHVDAAAGEFAHEQLTILRIAAIDPLHVELFVPARLWGQITTGDTLRVVPTPPLKGDWSARVSIVDQVFDAASGTFGVRLELPNPDGAIPAGIRCQTEITASH